MKTRSWALAVMALFVSLPPSLRAAELQVLAGGGIAGPMRELASQFEAATGHKLTVRFGTTPELIKLATNTPFDVAVVPREVYGDAAADAHFTGPKNEIARVGLGVAVKSGMPRPDIRTPEALKQALLKAQSIATTPASAAGAQVLRAFDKLGIGAEMKAKTKAQPGPQQIVEAVAQGDAELGVFLINTLTAPGLDVVGPFPAELQQEIFFVAAVAAASKQSDAAQAFIKHLKTPGSTSLIKAKGMTPG